MDPKHPPINYIYFIFSFSFLTLLIASSIFTKQNLVGSHYFFFLYAFGQIALEVSCFAFLIISAEKYLGIWGAFAMIGLSFIALIVHFLDFMMDRLLDFSVWEAFRVFVLDESLENFLYLLDASGVPLWGWVALLILFLSLPAVGFFFYRLSYKISKKRPLLLHPSFFLQTLICIPCALLVWDLSTFRIIQPDAYTSFIRTLPWKMTFLEPKNTSFSLPTALAPPTPEKELALFIKEDNTVLAHKPNIYLFVVESLREDSITQEIAPNLFQFKNDYIHFDRASSNGNGSHMSWFSLFHSEYPIFWQVRQKKWGMGSPALQLLKKWGYKIRLYSSAELGYYGMENLLFGSNLELLDSRQTFHHPPPLRACDTDMAALNKLQQDLFDDPSLKEGNLFIVFWDCTHFDYTWPTDQVPKFPSFAESFTYFQAFHSQKTIEMIKNRYHNAVHFMDHLFGKFLAALPQKEESVIIFTGDHGEEFFEQGHLFHNSHLTKEQTHIPLYFKFGQGKETIIDRKIVSQMDVFPSLLHYLAQKSIPFLKGNSLFEPPHFPFAMIARFNAGHSPHEFALHNGSAKLIARFQNRGDLFGKSLHVRSLRDENDMILPNMGERTEEWVHKEFDSVFKILCTPGI
jgi:glucan phosphoethanolaminetransferase (alkaline phosphatase superfamily)